MTTLTQQLRAITNSIPAKDRFLSGLAMRDYYENIGQYEPTKHIERSLKVGLGGLKLQYKVEEPTLLDAVIWRALDIKSDDNRLYAVFEKYPKSITEYFTYKYAGIFKEKGYLDASYYLRKKLGKNFEQTLEKRINLASNYYHGNKSSLSVKFWHQLMKLPDYNKSKIDNLAKKIAVYINDCIFATVHIEHDNFELSCEALFDGTPAHEAYKTLVNELKGLKITAPYFQHFKNNKLSEREALIAIAKVSDFEWWERQLKKRRDQQKEHLAIAVGQVQNKATPYASKSCQYEWREQKRNNREWSKNQVIENTDTGEQFELTLQIDKSNANPAIRRCELMVRMRGFEDLANEHGYIGAFVTITAPSKYHSCHSKGGFVANWLGNNPKETQRYLCQVWSKIRAKLSREEIRYFGFRVVEPHHDGTPHWHLLVFMLPEDRDKTESIMRDYAFKVDGNEPGAQENRFKFVDIDKEKGSATGYIAKYISKNIDGYALDGEQDNETGQDLKTMSKAITAWASRWRIRQFQQIGGAPVTVYRELRRLKGAKVEDKNIDPAIAAADVGCWASYTELQGGALVKRKNLKVRISYEETLNQYEEPQQKIKGIYSPIVGVASFICTRLIKWVIVSKKSGDSPAWSSVNNCTPKIKNQAGEQLERLRKRLFKRSKLDDIFDDLEVKEINFDDWLQNPQIRHQKKPKKELKEKLQFNKKVQEIGFWLKHTPKITQLPDIEWSF